MFLIYSVLDSILAHISRWTWCLSPLLFLSLSLSPPIFPGRLQIQYTTKDDLTPPLKSVLIILFVYFSCFIPLPALPSLRHPIWHLPYWLSLMYQFVHMSVNLCLLLFCCLNDCCSVFHVEKKCLKLYLLAVHPLICFNLFKRQSHFGKQKLIINTAPWLGSKYSWERSARGWLSTQAALKVANRLLLLTEH